MLKHVQISPLRNRADSVSMRSSNSCASSICGSPEPPNDLQRTPSRASSYSSLNEQLPQTTIKIYTSCLKIDIEYKTLGIQWESTSKEVIAQLLRRLKMRHRDPRLFYLSMEVSVRRADVKTVLVLDNDTRPAILQACHPKGESKFSLQLKPGGLIRVHTSALQPNSQYKSLVISEETTSDELLQLLLSCYNSLEPVEQFSIYEVCPGQEYQRKLHPDDLPLRAQVERARRGEVCHFLVRRNPNYARRRQLLAALTDTVPSNSLNTSAAGSAKSLEPSSSSSRSSSSICSLDESASLLDMSMESLSDELSGLVTSDEDEDCNSSTSSDSSNTSSNAERTAATNTISASKNISTILAIDDVCVRCRSNYKSCGFCQKNSALMALQRRVAASKHNNSSTQLPIYNPVYNVREIRTATHSFSSLGNDKKLLDIQLNGRFDALTCRMRPQSVYVGGSTQRTLFEDAALNDATDEVNGNPNLKPNSSDVANTDNADAGQNVISGPIDGAEAVNNNPAKGLGHFVYI